jgi:hypothetical protein
VQYLRNGWDYGLFFPSADMAHVQGVELHADADLVGELSKRKSTTGMGLTINVIAVNVMQLSKLQSITATSTAEAEYITASQAVKEGLWARQLLGAIKQRMEPMSLLCRVDNVGTWPKPYSADDAKRSSQAPGMSCNFATGKQHVGQHSGSSCKSCGRKPTSGWGRLDSGLNYCSMNSRTWDEL